jgi:hypothetical protein
MLLNQSNVHCTHSSSAVIEAELVGVPSIVWSAYGAELFDAQIRSGIASQVADGASFLAELHRPRRQDVSNPQWSGTSPVQHALNFILKLQA